MPKILLTARDPATACIINELLLNFDKQDFDVVLILEGPALTLVDSSKYKLEKFEPQPEYELNIAKCIDLIKEYKVDYVLTGISGPGVGIDEYMTSASKDLSVRSAAVQSFWGDINLEARDIPNKIYVCDDIAKLVTLNRCNSDVQVCGSIKHAGFGMLNLAEMRNAGLSCYGDRHHKVALVVGQPLHFCSGYIESIHSVAKSLSIMDEPLSVVYRKHPKESDDELISIKACFEKNGINVLVDNNSDVLVSLVSCDLLISINSTCGIDLQYLNKYSEAILGGVVYLSINDELNQWLSSYTDLDSLPYSSNGFAITVRKTLDLESSFKKALSLNFRRRAKGLVEKFLPDASKSPEILISSITKSLYREGGR